MSALPVDDIAGALNGIAHRYAVEGDTRVLRIGATLGLRYRKTIHHPWPRSIDYHVDILAHSLNDVAIMREAILTSPNETHVAEVFGMDVERDAAAANAAGYDTCWTTALLARETRGPKLSQARVRIERVTTPALLAESNALAMFPMGEGALGDPSVVAIIARDEEGAAIGKGRIVFSDAPAAYVADMFTAESERRAGVARAVLDALHAAALERGVKRVVLFPSLMAVETRFYVNAGYQSVCPVGVLLSKP